MLDCFQERGCIGVNDLDVLLLPVLDVQLARAELHSVGPALVATEVAHHFVVESLEVLVGQAKAQEEEGLGREESADHLGDLRQAIEDVIVIVASEAG